jgi:hypothetical protein
MYQFRQDIVDATRPRWAIAERIVSVMDYISTTAPPLIAIITYTSNVNRASSKVLRKTSGRSITFLHSPNWKYDSLSTCWTFLSDTSSDTAWCLFISSCIETLSWREVGWITASVSSNVVRTTHGNVLALRAQKKVRSSIVLGRGLLVM